MTSQSKLPQLRLDESIRCYALANIIANVHSFDDKMMLRSFGGRLRWSVDMSEAWCDVRFAREWFHSVGDGEDVLWTMRYAVNSATDGGPINTFIMKLYNGRYTLHYRRDDDIHGREVTMAVGETEDICVDALRYIRSNIRYISDYSGIIYIMRQLTRLGEWLPRLMVCRLTTLRLYTQGARQIVVDALPKMPKVTDVTLGGFGHDKEVEVLDKICVHGGQIHSLTISNLRADDWSTPPEYFANWTSLQSVRFVSLTHNFTMKYMFHHTVCYIFRMLSTRTSYHQSKCRSPNYVAFCAGARR